MSSPVVKFIKTTDYSGAVGDKIVTRAFDDFRLTRVRVEIYAANGTRLVMHNRTSMASIGVIPSRRRIVHCRVAGSR